MCVAGMRKFVVSVTGAVEHAFDMEQQKIADALTVKELTSTKRYISC